MPACEHPFEKAHRLVDVILLRALLNPAQHAWRGATCPDLDVKRLPAAMAAARSFASFRVTHPYPIFVCGRFQQAISADLGTRLEPHRTQGELSKRLLM